MDALSNFNQDLFLQIFNFSRHNPILDFLMVFGAEYLIFLMWFLIFIFALKGNHKERKSLLLFLISWPILFLIIKFIHLFLFEQRPYIANQIIPLISYRVTDASFPSRHASSSFAMAFAFLYFKSKYGGPLLLLATWVSISRVYVGVHYPLDILGGFVIGILSPLLAQNFLKFTGVFKRTNNL